jgi:hypothetical protein
MKSHNWMADEASREKHAGTKGKFSAKAARAGYGTQTYARMKQHAPGELGQEARMDLRFASGRRNRG